MWPAELIYHTETENPKETQRGKELKQYQSQDTVVLIVCASVEPVLIYSDGIKRSSVRPSVCLSRRSTAAAPAGGFAAEVERRQQISIDSCCCRAKCGPRKFRSVNKEVHYICYI